jgi:hypothetical protein
MPNNVLDGTTIAPVSIVSLIAVSVSGLSNDSRYTRSTSAKAWESTAHE